VKRARLGLAGATLLALGVVSCTAARRAPGPPSAPATIVVIGPEAAPAPAPAAPPAPPAPAPPPPRIPEVVRIGLRTDLESVTLPCCTGSPALELAASTWALSGPVTVRPAASASPPPVWRLQVAALREEEEAGGLARRVAELAGAPADARFDAGSGLFRVRVGAWPEREAAEAEGRRLQSRGLDAFWVVSEGLGPVDPALEVSAGGRTERIPGRRAVVRAARGAALAFEGRGYRGALAVYLNDRGRLNLVNELPLEDYLRGVVPRELGPASYPELEALKAQAVAARSYTLRNLGGFAEEGYDLCGTPKCQVYGAVAAEHPLTDRAVAETAGEVLVAAGAAIDALYSATCGGRTENVEVVFPLKSASYLRGVACIEGGSEALGGGTTGAWPPEEPAARRLVRRFEEIAGRDLVVRDGRGELEAHALGKGLATFRIVDRGAARGVSHLDLAPGDELELAFVGGRLTAVAQHVASTAKPFDKPHSRARWARFKSDQEIGASVRQRFPGFQFAGLDVVTRGPSGRISRLRLDGADGTSVEVEGLAVRWVLDLPETRFTVVRLRPRTGPPGWRFTGRGWGHGVGLCQTGSYAMARRGHDYRSILAHYYSGATLERLPLPGEGGDEGTGLSVRDQDQDQDQDQDRAKTP
jgi:peptidoglycan hydrolase-like amidase